jgi:hypothetical protein
MTEGLQPPLVIKAMQPKLHDGTHMVHSWAGNEAQLLGTSLGEEIFWCV